MTSSEEKHDARVPQAPTDFASQADEPQPGVLAEFWDFFLHNKKWWITPIIAVLLLMGLLMVLGGSSVAPFIYAIW
jgi:hypothetical protein